MGIRLIVLLSVLVAGCPAPPPAGRSPTTLVVGGGAPRQAPQVARDFAPFLVGGCNVECVDCASLDSDTYVIGTTAGQVEPLFAGPPFPGDAYRCAAQVPVGETVVLRAHGSSAFEFVGWRNHELGAADYCPCAGSADPVCEITVDGDVATRFGRAYCGAMWRPRVRR